MSLDLDLDICTPTGWQRFGDLSIGDPVFDVNGQPTRILGVSPIWRERPCYRLAFSDGAEIVTDQDHDWLVAAMTMPERLVESRQIASTLRPRGDTSDYALLYPGPLEFSASAYPPEADRRETLRMLIDAAGVEAEPVCNCGEQRKEEVHALEEVRLPRILPGHLHKPGCPLHVAFSEKSTVVSREMDYIELSTEAMQTGRLFSADTVKLVVELIRSLGYAVKIGEGHIGFWNDPPKAARARRRYVIGCKRCPSAPVRCIQVENSSGLFLVGRTLLPTHDAALIA